MVKMFAGVVRVEFEGENKVKVICLKNVDPEKLRDKLQEKTSKKFELILPQQPKKDAKQNVKQTENKPKEVYHIFMMGFILLLYFR